MKDVGLIYFVLGRCSYIAIRLWHRQSSNRVLLISHVLRLSYIIVIRHRMVSGPLAVSFMFLCAFETLKCFES
jgi:hypothetical protein